MNDKNVSADQVQRFSFDETNIRGVITHLDRAFIEVADKHQYPQQILEPLGELMVGAAILSTNLKFPGRLTLQVRLAEGPVSLLQAEVNDQGQIRAIARYDETAEYAHRVLALNNGQLVITIEPDQGQKYQGITLIESDSIADALAGYFKQSEQLDTGFWLFCDGARAAGMMLQKLPTQPSEDVDAWERLQHLTATVRQNELFDLSFDAVLHRLFHEEAVRIYPHSSIQFFCTCSEPRIATALTQLGKDELLQILQEQHIIKINCEFCQQTYQFDEQSVDALFEKPSQSLH